MTSAGNEDLFLGKLSGTDGSHIWSRRFGDVDEDEVLKLVKNTFINLGFIFRRNEKLK